MRKGNEKPWKRPEIIKRVFSYKLVLIGLIAFILILNLARAMSNEPQIINAKVNPLKVQSGDILITTIEFKDDYGIISAVASYEHENKDCILINLQKDCNTVTDEIPMSLIEGDKLEGTYKAAWIVHDTKVKKYYTTVYLTNKIGLTSMRKLEWWDPVVGHNASAISADAFDSGNFTFQDDLYVNDRLGIGTTNPTYKLQVELTTGNTDDSITTSQIKGIKINETTSTGGYSDMGLIMGSGAGESAFITGHRVSTSSIDLSLGASDVEVIRIKGSTGKVGIGTTNPQQKLNVAGELNVTQGLNLSMYQSCTALETDASGNVLCGTDDTGGGADGNVSSICSDNEVLLGQDSTTCVDLNATIDNLDEKMDYTNVCMLNDTDSFTGNVTFDDEVELKSGVNFTSFTSCTALETDAEGNLVCGSDDSGTGGVQDYTNIAMTNQSNTFGNHDQTFDTDTLFLDSAGDKIGIGTIYPQQKLNVVGELNVTNGLNLSMYQSCTALETDSAGNMLCGSDDIGAEEGTINSTAWNKTGTNVFLADPDDSVGIGTNTPGSKLTVYNGNLNVSNATGTTLFVDGDTGYVGIGTTNPQQELNVVGDANITGYLTVGGEIRQGSTDYGAYGLQTEGKIYSVDGLAIDINDATHAGLNIILDQSTTNNGADVTLTVDTNSGSPIVDWYISNWGGSYNFSHGSASGKVSLFSVDATGKGTFAGNLQVDGTASVTGVINADATSTAISADGDLVFTGSGDIIDFSDDAADKVHWYSNTYGTGIESSTLTDWSGSQFRWRVGGTTVSGGTERMLLDSSGNLQMDGDLTVSGGNINLPFGDNALESVDEWLRINDGGEHSAGVYMGTSVLGVGNTYIGGYDAATGEIDLLANGNINMVGTLTAADIECTKCIDTGDLKTVNTGLLSGTCVTRGDRFNLVMNDYAFFPNFGDNTGTANGYLGFRSYNSITTDDTVGRLELNCGDPLNYEIRWRYVTASRTPELFVWYDLENKVLRQVWHSEIEHPEVLPIEYNNIPKDTDGNPLWIPIQVTVFDKSLLEMDGAELRKNYTITRYEKPENLSSEDELLIRPKEEGAVLITHPEIYYGKLEYCSTCADSLVALENNSFEQEKPAMPMTNTVGNQTAIILENQQKIQELEKRLASLENMIEQSNGSVIIKVK